MKPSFSLKWLFVGIALAGVCVKSLYSPSDFWASISSTITLLILGLAASRLFLRQSNSFWVGFVVFGWAHAYFAWNVSGPMLATAYLIDYLGTIAEQYRITSFQDAANSWLTLLVGVCGGAITALIWSRGSDEQQTTP